MNNTQTDIYVVVPMYNLIEHNNNYSRISRSLWAYNRDELPATIVNSKSFISKIRITGKTSADGNA